MSIKNYINHDNHYSKQIRQSNNCSVLKNSFNTKMNNSIATVNNPNIKKVTIFNYKTKNNIKTNYAKQVDINISEFNTTTNNLL